MKKLILLGGCLWAFAAQPAKAQTSSSDVVVVKVLESQLATRIIIARSWGFPDEMEVKAGFSGNEVTMAKESAKKIQEVLGKLYEQGYAIRSTFSSSGGGPSTMVLVKGQ